MVIEDSQSELATALEHLGGGEEVSRLDRAFTSWYPDLKRVAHARLRGSGLQGQLQTTALVHESYLKLASGPDREFPDRLHFLAYASRTLRSLIVDTVREERAQRRGGGADIVTLDTAAGEGLAPSVDVMAIDDALVDLAKIDASLARLVEMRFFGGLTEPEVAAALGISERTVRREWQKARALLLTLIGG